MRKLFIATILIISILSLSACFDTEEYRLTDTQKQRVDSLFNKMYDSLSQELDSICVYEYDTRFKRAVDSIRLVRYEEINQLLEN